MWTVRNIKGTTKDRLPNDDSWTRYWKRITGQPLTDCCIANCQMVITDTSKQLVGGHMWCYQTNHTRNYHYILPICDFYNNHSREDRDQTKANPYMVRIGANPTVGEDIDTE
ncbi:hypothetical protein HKX48_002129 [Thoreauomyces humboldtii]|nr:hypothetical protein HKX48_002129 [Thoreauomyces humboldtii]